MPACHAATVTRAVRPEPSPVIGEIDGIEIEVAGVVIWPAELEIRLACRPNDRTRQTDIDYASAVADWRARRERGSDDDFPENPTAALFRDRRPQLTDDLGTLYNWDSGGGWGWDGDHGIRWGTSHTFRPSPPPSATWLDIALALDPGQMGTMRVLL
jgi:hypothetical protein